MKYSVEVLSPEQWATVSEGTHFEVFGTLKPKDWDRIDYALLALREGEPLPMAYVTCREVSRDCVYWQFGGVFPEVRGTFATWAIYKTFIEWARAKYKMVSTYTANDNYAYLKMALKAGFKIIGTRNVDGQVFVDLKLDFKGEE